MKENAKNIYYPSTSEKEEQDRIHQRAVRMVLNGAPLSDAVCALRREYRSCAVKYKSLRGSD